jgi:endonuclease G, mitochondrial
MFDPDFLGTTVVAPLPVGDVADDVLDVDGTTQWDYAHFSLAMSASRRLARWVAWHIDGLTLFPSESIPRADDFRLDPRLPAEAQTGEEVYAGNDLDRGHLARRSDLLWGSIGEAQAANEDSFFFTNIAPQMNDFNQSGLDGVWGLLEDAVLEEAGLERRRLTLFGGPVLSDDDVVHRGVLIPGAYWKVVVYVLDGTLSARCFVLAQEVEPLVDRLVDRWGDLLRLSVTLDDFATYEVSLGDLEALVSLTFTSLHAPAVGVRTDAPPRRIVDVREVDW